MEKYDFDKIIERRGTDSVKYDLLKPLFGKEDITPLWVADMDFEVPDFIRSAVLERARHPVYGYTFRPGRFYETVAGWMERRHGWKINPAHINFSPGVVPALNLAVLAYTSPGDRVLVQPPVYFPFFTAIENHGRKLVNNQLVEKDGIYSIDFDDLEHKFREGVKMMLFCHPHNPVGRAWNRDELAKLANLCIKHRVLVLSDEIHSDLLLFGHRHIPFASINEEIAQLTITCVAPSKTFNLAGLHSSAVIIENSDLKKQYDQMLDHMHIGGGNLFGQVAMEAAYREGDDWLNQLLTYLEENFKLLNQFICEEIPQLKVSPLEATYLVWIGMHKLQMEDVVITKMLLDEAKLGLVDGPRFGPGGESYQRLNIALPKLQLEKALKQLAEAVHTRSSKKT